MEKSPNTTRDIATEQYQGPSALVASVGHGAIEHLLYAIGGLASAGTLAYIFHKPAAALVKKSQAAGTWLKEYESNGSRLIDVSKDNITTWAGRVLHVIFGDPDAADSLRKLENYALNDLDKERIKYIAMNKEQGFGNMFLSHTIGGLPKVGKKIKEGLYNAESRTANAIAVGGVAGAGGYIGGWLKAAFTGAKHGNKGKDQFAIAQTEIINLREKNEQLEEKITKAEKQLKESELTQKLRVSGDDTTVKAPGTPQHASLSSAEHQGKMQAEKAVEPELA